MAKMDLEDIDSLILSLDDSFPEADAQLISIGYVPELPKLTSSEIKEIETSLPLYDHIAFAFLAYRDPQDALDRITRAIELQKAGSVWQSCIIQPWIDIAGPASRYAFIEILHALQQWKLLRTLRAGRESRNLVYIDKFRHALFRVIDGLDNPNFDILAKKMDGFTSVVDYVEVKFLSWVIEGKIRENNCAELITTLRELGKGTEAQHLEVTLLDLSLRTRDESSGERPSIAVNSLPALSSVISSPLRTYPFNPRTAGLCVIINQRDFFEHLSKTYPTRYGTDRDCQMLCSTFKMFGLQIEVKENLTSYEVTRYLSSVAKKDFTHMDVLVICLLAHGVEGAIIGTDGEELKVSDIKTEFSRNESLIGKPKLFFVQACQGNRGQAAVQQPYSDLDTDGQSQSSPEISDFLEFWATVPGFVSYRSKQSGSRFIQTLCEQLQASGHELVFDDIMKKVNDVVSFIDNRTSITSTVTKQMPVYTSCLRGHLKFARHDELFIDSVVDMLLDRCFDKYFENGILISIISMLGIKLGLQQR